MRRPRIAVIHPHLVAGGGSEARPLWLAEALKGENEVHLLTMGPVDLSLLNESYETKLNQAEITLVRFPFPPVVGHRFDALKAFPLERYCRKKSNRYDLMISAYNIMDFGRRGLQFIADFSFADDLRREFYSLGIESGRLIYRDSPLRKFYMRGARWLSGASRDGWKTNYTVANSEWSRRVMQNRFGVDGPVIYPPVSGNFPGVAWDERENGFVFLGRVTPQKRVHHIVEILTEVRRAGHEIHLHIIGRADNPRYELQLRKMCRERREWCFLEDALFGSRKKEFLARHKYGISGCKQEAFGIAVAEMAKAGCVIWVPRGGGQTEIVRHPELEYDGIEDAVKKIKGALGNPSYMFVLREHLSRQGKLFSAERFMSESRALISELLAYKDRVDA